MISKTENTMIRALGAIVLLISDLVFARNYIWKTFFSNSDMAIIGSIGMAVILLVVNYYIFTRIILIKETKTNEVH